MIHTVNILITGGCGYIGWNLAKELICLGCGTVVLFDVSPPKYKKHFAKNLNWDSSYMGTNSKCKILYVEGDICNYSFMDDTIKRYSIDAVFHVAGYGLSGNNNLPAHGDRTNTVNIFGTENVVRACLVNNVRALG